MGVITSPQIQIAMTEVDRSDFVPDEVRSMTYVDEALPIGHGQTISQPYTVAFMLELLQPKRGHKILDVGSGSGWTTALLAHLAGVDGEVIGVERVPELVIFGQLNLMKYQFPQADIRKATPGVYGIPHEAPFDRILVSAEASEIPQELLDQLASPGIMVIPIHQTMIKVTKDNFGSVSQEECGGFVFVPLVKE